MLYYVIPVLLLTSGTLANWAPHAQPLRGQGQEHVQKEIRRAPPKLNPDKDTDVMPKAHRLPVQKPKTDPAPSVRAQQTTNRVGNVVAGQQHMLPKPPQLGGLFPAPTHMGMMGFPSLFPMMGVPSLPMHPMHHQHQPLPMMQMPPLGGLNFMRPTFQSPVPSQATVSNDQHEKPEQQNQQQPQMMAAPSMASIPMVTFPPLPEMSTISLPSFPTLPPLTMPPAFQRLMGITTKPKELENEDLNTISSKRRSPPSDQPDDHDHPSSERRSAPSNNNHDSSSGLRSVGSRLPKFVKSSDSDDLTHPEASPDWMVPF